MEPFLGLLDADIRWPFWIHLLGLDMECLHDLSTFAGHLTFPGPGLTMHSIGLKRLRPPVWSGRRLL